MGAVLLALQVATAVPLIGVASTMGPGRVCLSMPGPPLAAGSVVTLVQPDAPQSVTRAIVGAPLETCGELDRGTIPGPYYSVRLPSGPVPGTPTLWVAFAGERHRIRVRSCTSEEGLHLTAWSGAPLRSRRLWHAYFYLGYDVEPSCRPADFEDVAK